jgi:hypothetical protein
MRLSSWRSVPFAGRATLILGLTVVCWHSSRADARADAFTLVAGDWNVWQHTVGGGSIHASGLALNANVDLADGLFCLSCSPSRTYNPHVFAVRIPFGDPGFESQLNIHGANVPLDTIAVTLDGTFDYLTAPLFLDGPLAVPTPITFHGTLTGVDVSTGALAFRHTLTGTGTASLGQIELGTPLGSYIGSTRMLRLCLNLGLCCC